MQVGDYADWSSWSDHCPLMVEIPSLLEAAH